MELRARKIISKNNDAHLSFIRNIMKKRLYLKVFKIFNKLSNKNVLGYFEKIDSNTRNIDILLRLPKAKLESFKKASTLTEQNYLMSCLGTFAPPNPLNNF